MTTYTDADYRHDIAALGPGFQPFTVERLRRAASWQNRRRMNARVIELERRIAAGTSIPIEHADIADMRRIMAIQDGAPS